MTPAKQFQGSTRLFIKVLLGNIAPILWLFVWQPLMSVRFDGVGFWIGYAVFSIVVSVGLWLANRTIPDPSHTTSNEVATPIRGIVAAGFQILVCLATMGVYFRMN
jgi:hypothetical protein